MSKQLHQTHDKDKIPPIIEDKQVFVEGKKDIVEKSGG